MERFILGSEGRDILIIPTEDGDRKLPVDRINYIDIEQRTLCYHTSMGGSLAAKNLLRTSFAKATEPYLQYRNLLFLKPSLIINVDNIEYLNKESLIFSNGEEFYFPRRRYDEIYERWCECG